MQSCAYVMIICESHSSQMRIKLKRKYHECEKNISMLCFCHLLILILPRLSQPSQIFTLLVFSIFSDNPKTPSAFTLFLGIFHLNFHVIPFELHYFIVSL